MLTILKGKDLARVGFGGLLAGCTILATWKLSSKWTKYRYDQSLTGMYKKGFIRCTKPIENGEVTITTPKECWEAYLKTEKL